MEAIGRKKRGSPRLAGSHSGVGSCTRLTLVCLLTVTLWGNAPEVLGHNGPLFAHFDADNDGLLNMTEAELFMASVVADPAGLASCPNASSLVHSRDGDGDSRLNSTEVEGMSWDLLQCIHTSSILCSATATVTTSSGSYVCAAEQDHEEGETAVVDPHGHGATETVEVIFPGSMHGTWHCEVEEPVVVSPHSTSSKAERWGLGILASVVVSLISLIGIFLVSLQMLSVAGLTDYMGALAVGAIISCVFIDMVIESAEGDRNSQFGWRTGTCIMAGLMAAFLLESIVRSVRAVMGLQAHDHGTGCVDSPRVSVSNEADPALAYATGSEDPVPGVGVPAISKPMDDRPCYDHAPERLVMPVALMGPLSPLRQLASSPMGRHAGVLPSGTASAMVDLSVADAEPTVTVNSIPFEDADSGQARELELAGVGSPTCGAGVVQAQGHPLGRGRAQGSNAHSHGHGHGHGHLPDACLQGHAHADADGPVVPRNRRPSLKRRMTEKFLSTESVAFVILIGDFVHNAVDGLVIGASFSLCDTSAGWGVTFAIMLHEIPQELSDFIVLRRSGLSITSALLLNLASGSSCVIGTMAGLASANISPSTQSMLISFCAGMLMFVALVDILPDLMTISNVHSKWMAAGHVVKRFALIAIGAAAVGLTKLHERSCAAIHAR